MKFKKSLPLILILTVCCSIHSYAATDSLPSCIKNIQPGTLTSYTEYDYEGKTLYSFTTVSKTKPIKYYDSLGSIRYYDSACKIFCTWIKGGIMGSKMIPYTIKKEKIITTRVVVLDTAEVKKAPAPNSLPDTISTIAFLKKSTWIEETMYDGKLVYRFQNPSDKTAVSNISFVHPYFDETGKIITVVKLTRRAFWWHNVNGKFSRTQFRPGFR